jgi:hypothetical protein
MIDNRLKKIIFKKLTSDLSHVEVIPYDEGTWFIDRDNKYLFLYLSNESLWWRYDFFENFFSAFSLKQKEYEPIIIEWVKEMLNVSIEKTDIMYGQYNPEVEEVLNNTRKK